MPVSIRTILLTVLILLQFIAPLVHAHAGQNISDQGLHIPGLESYSAPDPGQSLLSSTRMTDADGFIFMVDAGINQHRQPKASDRYIPVILPLLTRIQAIAEQAPISSPIPLFLPCLSQDPILKPLSPRAPPA